MNRFRNPVVLLIVNFIVGALVAHGVVEPTEHSTAVEMLSEVLGLGIVFLTSIVSLYKFLKHPHDQQVNHHILYPQNPMTKIPAGDTVSMAQSVQPPMYQVVPVPPSNYNENDTGTPPVFSPIPDQTGTPTPVVPTETGTPLNQ